MEPNNELKSAYKKYIKHILKEERKEKLKKVNKKFNIITLCGSTKFKDQFIEENKRLTLEGNIVISVGLFGHSGDNEVWSENTKEMLDEIHKAKIDLADEIFVINVDGYVGESTKNEIEYATKNGKKISYLEAPESIIHNSNHNKPIKKFKIKIK